MPKKRQIPNLFPQQLAGGDIAWHWKPSKKLRALGFTNQKLGVGGNPARAPKHITIAAIDLNNQVDALTSGADSGRGEAARPSIRLVRFGQAAQDFLASDDFRLLKPTTQAEYRSRLIGERGLQFWAEDGALFVRDIDKAMVMDLRRELLKGSRYRAAALLRVLRLFLAWCVREGIILANPAAEVDVPTPPSRRHVVAYELVGRLAAAAAALEDHPLALAIHVAFWTLQRQGDILALNRFAWREIPRVDPRHAVLLADPMGRVRGLQVQQSKTGAWVMAPTPPTFHESINAAITASEGGWLFCHPQRGKEPMPDWMFQRRFKAVRAKAVEALDTEIEQAGGESAELTELRATIAGCQFRDLRRSGMVFYRTAGARTAWITAVSGHAVIGRKTILDTYMPADTEAAAACVATGLAWLAELEARRSADG